MPSNELDPKQAVKDKDREEQERIDKLTAGTPTFRGVAGVVVDPSGVLDCAAKDPAPLVKETLGVPLLKIAAG